MRGADSNPRSRRPSGHASRTAQPAQSHPQGGALPMKPTVADLAKGERLGVSVHALVGECLQDGLRHPTPVELLTRAGRYALTVDSRNVHRQAAKQALLTTAAVYFRWFTPPDEWGFLGTEITARGCRFDLVWQTAGQVVVDEIKSGAMGVPGRGGFEPQVARLIQGGATKYGDAFVGVRVIILAAPALSYLARPGGDREPLL